MKKLLIAAAAVAPLVSFAGLYGDIPDAKHAWSVHDWNRPKPAKVMPADVPMTAAAEAAEPEAGVAAADGPWPAPTQMSVTARTLRPLSTNLGTSLVASDTITPTEKKICA